MAALCGTSYQNQAARILRDFLEDYSIAEIEQAVNSAYDASRWDDPDIAPVKALANNVYVLELFHGPTAAFKDVALSILPQLMGAALKKKGVHENVMILTATSGDTGSAALTGFCDVPGIRVLA